MQWAWLFGDGDLSRSQLVPIYGVCDWEKCSHCKAAISPAPVWALRWPNQESVQAHVAINQYYLKIPSILSSNHTKDALYLRTAHLAATGTLLRLRLLLLLPYFTVLHYFSGLNLNTAGSVAVGVPWLNGCAWVGFVALFTQPTNILIWKLE